MAILYYYSSIQKTKNCKATCCDRLLSLWNLHASVSIHVSGQLTCAELLHRVDTEQNFKLTSLNITKAPQCTVSHPFLGTGHCIGSGRCLGQSGLALLLNGTSAKDKSRDILTVMGFELSAL